MEQSFDHRDEIHDNDYTYDKLDRLTDIDYHEGGDEGFACDKPGNRTGTQDLREGTEDYSEACAGMTWCGC